MRCIAVPASRYVDIWKRNILMACGIFVATTMTALCGLAQNFWQFFATVWASGLAVWSTALRPIR